MAHGGVMGIVLYPAEPIGRWPSAGSSWQSTAALGCPAPGRAIVHNLVVEGTAHWPHVGIEPMTSGLGT